jgi:hypothetical protein
MELLMLGKNCLNLTTGCPGTDSNNVVFFGQRFSFQLEQAAFFQQSAEIFFAGVTMLAFAAVEIFQDFIGHFQSLEVNDADVFIAVFPDLALLEFERHA